jgi:hypothetical protein
MMLLRNCLFALLSCSVIALSEPVATEKIFSDHYQAAWLKTLEYMELKVRDIEYSHTLDASDTTVLGTKDRPSRIFKINKTGATCGFTYKQSEIEPKEPDFKKVYVLCIGTNGKPNVTIQGLPENFIRRKDFLR